MLHTHRATKSSSILIADHHLERSSVTVLSPLVLLCGGTQEKVCPSEKSCTAQSCFTFLKNVGG